MKKKEEKNMISPAFLYPSWWFCISARSAGSADSNKVQRKGLFLLVHKTVNSLSADLTVPSALLNPGRGRKGAKDTKVTSPSHYRDTFLGELPQRRRK